MVCAGPSEAQGRCTQSSLRGPTGLLESTVSAERESWAVCGKASGGKSDVSSDCRSWSVRRGMCNRGREVTVARTSPVGENR